MNNTTITNTTDQTGQEKQDERLAFSPKSNADLAADFAQTFLMHRHRGVINCGSYFILFGNDGFSKDQRSRKESADVWGRLRQYDTESGLSSDGNTWTLILTDHSRTLFDEEELEQLVWDTWITVCDQLGRDHDS